MNENHQNGPLQLIVNIIELIQFNIIIIVCFFTVDTWTVAFSPDSKYIATGSHAGKISLIGVESGKKESALDTRGKFTMSIAYVCYFFLNVITCLIYSLTCTPHTCLVS